jgi:hypothetical protein
VCFCCVWPGTEAALDLTGLPAGLLPLLPLFCRSLTQVGG